MKPYHLRRPPWRDIRENHACYVSELPANPVEDWTYIIDGVHYYYSGGKYLNVNPAWTFAAYSIAFICKPSSYQIVRLDNFQPMAEWVSYPS